MTFTDDDLKRLKEDIKDLLYVNIGDDEHGDPNEVDLKALLTRLDAAEALAFCPPEEQPIRLSEWRKACGR